MVESVGITAKSAQLTIEDWAVQNLDRLGELLGTDPAAFLDALDSKTCIHEEQEDFNRALKFYNGVLAGQEKLLGPDQALTLSIFRKVTPQNLRQGTLNRSFKLYK